MDIYSVIADPVRREILEVLHEGPLNAGEIARRFPISRPAISRHLRVLRESGLVTVEPSGRARAYRVDPSRLEELDAWLAQFRNTWESRLDALETEVHRTRRARERQQSGLAETSLVEFRPQEKEKKSSA